MSDDNKRNVNVIPATSGTIITFLYGYFVGGESISNGFFAVFFISLLFLSVIIPFVGFWIFFFDWQYQLLAMFTPVGLGNLFAFSFFLGFIIWVLWSLICIGIVLKFIDQIGSSSSSDDYRWG